MYASSGGLWIHKKTQTRLDLDPKKRLFGCSRIKALFLEQKYRISSCYTGNTTHVEFMIFRN